MMVTQPTLILSTLLSSIAFVAAPAADVSTIAAAPAIIDLNESATMMMKESVTTPATHFSEIFSAPSSSSAMVVEEVVVVDVDIPTTWWQELVQNVETTTADIQASVCNKLHETQASMDLPVDGPVATILTHVSNNMLRCPVRKPEPSKIQTMVENLFPFEETFGMTVDQFIDSARSSYTACAIRNATDGIVKNCRNFFQKFANTSSDTMAGDQYHWTIISSVLSWVYFIFVTVPLCGIKTFIFSVYWIADCAHHCIGWMLVGVFVYLKIFYSIFDFPQARTTADILAHIQQVKEGNWKFSPCIQAILSRTGAAGGDIDSPLRANYVLFGLRVWNYFHADAIKTSYRVYSLKYHPDKYDPENCDGLTREEATAVFQTINQAYRVAKAHATRG
eukprot:CAMPEP_0113442750 /NCGR_PEP_ID=MMETSP0014_2-20120614/1774_1 /TAXON_ID=2857 /ORGANISM="Nitzschia sp." /LENGTH=391 /DNA_ID=CAMNT_0000333665 /DNA_START=489 /DNA_END=1664 /DNA_ORIENTATION=- /assembly_acc=CAM_ASM_000159